MQLQVLKLKPGENTVTPPEWSSERLQALMQSAADQQVVVVSCREPYSHDYTENGVVVTCPASGLVTALEPVVRACRGTWIAHASGSADAEFVNQDGVCLVPPDRPEYSLLRVWLEDEEKRHFLDGFSNESLWPMCHPCEVEPTFRAADWGHYRRVNERFADAVVQAATQDDPLVLVQDYHFALLPELIRARLPRATVVTFWHIPWPEFDRLKACPWWPALVRGLMSSSIVGFQTPRDQCNFNEAVAAYPTPFVPVASLPARSNFPVVATYPISVAWPTPSELSELPRVDDCRQQVRRENGLRPDTRLIVGVDRLDYTKGLVEKVHALETLLERYPQWRGRVSLVQVAAPTRSQLPAYLAYQQWVRTEVERVNKRFGCDGVLPIVLLETQHGRSAICRLYRAACLCAVTSLHDGMNLVSKEFVSLREDEQGILVLSEFAGAAQELQRDAVIVDPRDPGAMANSFAHALMMEPDEQQRRMRRMRRTIREANIYQWAGTMLSDTAALRDSRSLGALASWQEAA